MAKQRLSAGRCRIWLLLVLTDAAVRFYVFADAQEEPFWMSEFLPDGPTTDVHLENSTMSDTPWSANLTELPSENDKRGLSSSNLHHRPPVIAPPNASKGSRGKSVNDQRMLDRGGIRDSFQNKQYVRKVAQAGQGRIKGSMDLVDESEDLQPVKDLQQVGTLGALSSGLNLNGGRQHLVDEGSSSENSATEGSMSSVRQNVTVTGGSSPDEQPNILDLHQAGPPTTPVPGPHNSISGVNDAAQGQLSQDSETPGFSLKASKVCTEDICHQAAKDIEESLSSAEPCNDVKQFICGSVGGFESGSAPSDEPSWGTMEREQRELLEIAERIMGSGLMREWDVMKAARTVFEGCMDVETIEVDSGRAWKTVSNKLGGFPISQKFWRERAYDWISSNHLMMQMFGKSALINLEVLADKKIHISLGGAQLPREVLIDYQRSPPLLQSWIDLFYRTMEELWSEDIIDDSDAGADSRGSEAVEGDLLKPEKLVASLTKDNVLLTEGSHGAAAEQASQQGELKVTAIDEGSSHEDQKKPIADHGGPHQDFQALKEGFNMGEVAEPEGLRPELRQQDGHSRQKRSFLWMFPSRKKDSKVPNRDYFDIMANETIKLEIEIASLIEHYSKEDVEELTYSELVAKVSSDNSTASKLSKLDIGRLIALFLQDSMSRLEDFTFVAKPGELRELQALLSTYLPRDVANALGWRALYQLLDHMPHRFRSFKHQFDIFRLKAEKARQRSQVCSKVIVENFSLMMAHIIYDKVDSRRKTQMVMDLQFQMQSAWQQVQSSRNCGVAPEVKPKPSGNGHRLPDWLMDRRAVSRYYEGLDFERLRSKSHLGTMILLNAWRNTALKEQDSSSSSDGLGILELFLTEDSGSRTPGTTYMIPDHLLKYPLFDSDLPLALNYAGLGWLIFSTMLRDSGHDCLNSTEIGVEDVSTFIELYSKVKEQRSGHLDSATLLPGSLPSDFSEVQLLLIYWTKTWVCGWNRLEEGTPDWLDEPGRGWDKGRESLLSQVVPHFKTYFSCNSFLLRERPLFNIDHFLKKDTS